MITKIQEYNGCFSIEFQAENIQEAALITRFGMNAREKVNSLCSSVHNNGEFHGSVIIAKHRRADQIVPKRH